jgi:hypothetical protein
MSCSLRLATNSQPLKEPSSTIVVLVLALHGGSRCWWSSAAGSVSTQVGRIDGVAGATGWPSGLRRRVGRRWEGAGDCGAVGWWLRNGVRDGVAVLVVECGDDGGRDDLLVSSPDARFSFGGCLQSPLVDRIQFEADDPEYPCPVARPRTGVVPWIWGLST